MTWKEVTTGIAGEMESWQNMRNGEVLSIEKVSRSRYQVITLPENWKDDNQVIELIDTTETLSQATVAAEAYRKGESE